MSDFDINHFFTKAATGSLFFSDVREAIYDHSFTMDTVDIEGNTLLDVATAAGNWILIDALLKYGTIKDYILPKDHFDAFALKHSEEEYSPELCAVAPPSWWIDSTNLEIKKCLKGEWVLDAISYGFWPVVDLTQEEFGNYAHVDVVMISIFRIIAETDIDGSAKAFLKNKFAPESKDFERLTLETNHDYLQLWGSFSASEMEAYAPINGIDNTDLESQEWSLLHCDKGFYLHPCSMEGGGGYASIDGELLSATLLLLRNAPSDMPDDWF